ncbi:MAG: hypothetical protein U1E33_07265 [Rhodospirillales bacterium]
MVTRDVGPGVAAVGIGARRSGRNGGASERFSAWHARRRLSGPHPRHHRGAARAGRVLADRVELLQAEVQMLREGAAPIDGTAALPADEASIAGPSAAMIAAERPQH